MSQEVRKYSCATPYLKHCIMATDRHVPKTHKALKPFYKLADEMPNCVGREAADLSKGPIFSWASRCGHRRYQVRLVVPIRTTSPVPTTVASSESKPRTKAVNHSHGKLFGDVWMFQF